MVVAAVRLHAGCPDIPIAMIRETGSPHSAGDDRRSSCVASRSAPAASRCNSTSIRRRKPAGTEVLLKVLAAGVCHSDLHLSDGYFDLGGGKRMSLEDRGMKLPVTLGHENVGEVVAVGPQAQGVKIGDRACWRIPGSAAAPARSASAARKTSAAP